MSDWEISKFKWVKTPYLGTIGHIKPLELRKPGAVMLPPGKTKYIHINQHVIKRNAKTGEREPVVTCKTYNSNHYGHEVELHDGGSVVYRPDKPLACGAKVWIVTKGAVTISYEVHI